jgi:peptidoglycan/LPS O-acetylase OafA/YrhL
LITSILLNCRSKLPPSGGVGATLKAFYARRALRIFPAYYATILLFLVSGSSGFREVLPYHLFYLSNTLSATYSQDGLAHAPSAHFWSLSVEEQFYLVWPLVVLLVPLRWLPVVAMGVVLLAPASRLFLFAGGYPHIVGYLPTATDALVMGSLLAMARSGQFQLLERNRRWTWAMGGSLVGLMACLGLYNLGVGYRPREVMVPFFAAIVFTGLVLRLVDGGLPRITAFLSWSPLVEVGRVSYAIYLLHTLVMDGMTHVFPGLSAPSLLRFAMATAATIGVALLSWRIFEGPLNDLKRFFPYPSTHAKGRDA